LNRRRYREASKARPLAVAFVTCYGKGTASDLVAQMLVERTGLGNDWEMAMKHGEFLGIGDVIW